MVYAEADSAVARAFLVSSAEFHAPWLLKSETAGGLWKNWRLKTIKRDHAREALAALDRAIDVWHPSSGLFDAAVALSFDLVHPVYDCFYIALAQRLAAPVVTSDKRLLKIAPKNLAIALVDWKP
jgi:predicted nucleic acid-binding protein